MAVSAATSLAQVRMYNNLIFAVCQTFLGCSSICIHVACLLHVLPHVSPTAACNMDANAAVANMLININVHLGTEQLCLCPVLLPALPCAQPYVRSLQPYSPIHVQW